MWTENEAAILPLINKEVLAEPQQADAINLKILIFCFLNGTFKSLLCDLFILGAAVILLQFYLPFKLQFFCC